VNALRPATTWLGGYPFAAAIAVLWAGLRFVLEPIIDLDAPFLLSEPAVALAAWASGFGPGLLAVGLSAAFGFGFLVPDGFSAETGPLVGRLLVFVVLGAGIAWLAAALRRLWEEEYARRQELSAILDSIADGVTVIDTNGVVRYANEAAARQMGRHVADDVVGRSAAELAADFELLDADGRPLDLARLPTRRAMAGEMTPEETVRFRAPGAADQWSIVRARAIRNADGRPRLTVTAFQDVTGLKRSERRLALLAEIGAIVAVPTEVADTLQRVADAVVPSLADACAVDIVEADGMLRVAVAHHDAGVRGRWEEERRRWAAAGGLGGGRLVVDSGAPVHQADISDQMVADAAHDDAHLALLRSLGVRSTLSVPLPIRDEVVGAMTLFITSPGRTFDADDVTLTAEVGRRTGAAIDATRMLGESQRAVQLRDEFMAIASHDMRTPLASVRGYAQLLRRRLMAGGQPVEAPLVDMVDRIDESAARLTRMVAEFLDASLIRGGEQLTLEIEPTDVVALMRERVEEHRGQLTKGHRLVFTCETAEAIVRVDAGRLARVLDNLLTNAVKFSPDAGEIIVHVAPRGDGFVGVDVSDHGIGIEPGDLPRIFDTGFRGANATGLPGMGLGLSGSRAVVQQMDGTITVSSEVGKGSTFTVTLPIAVPVGELFAGP